MAKKYFRSEIFPRRVSQRGIALSVKFLWKCRSRNTHFSQHFSETKRRSFVRGRTTIIRNYVIHTITRYKRHVAYAHLSKRTRIRNTHAHAYARTRWCWSVIAMLNVIWHSTLGRSLVSGKEKLGVPQNENVSLVLESDGTQVEDGEYFKTLGNNTILLLLRHGERWCPTGVDIIRAGRWKGPLHPSILGEIGSLVEGFKVEATQTTENFRKECLKKTIMSLKGLRDCEIPGSHGIFFCFCL